jgi:hypothetical protein
MALEGLFSNMVGMKQVLRRPESQDLPTLLDPVKATSLQPGASQPNLRPSCGAVFNVCQTLS